MGTVIQDTQRSNDDRHQRWERIERAEFFEPYRDLQAQGLSLRQAAKALEVPSSTLQAWRAYQDSLDAHPAVVAFFHRAPGLAFLHRLVLGIPLGCTEVGACGMRLGCLLVQRTGLDRFVAASSGAQHQVNRQLEEAIVAYRREESARLAKDMPAKDLTVAQDATCTGGLCLGWQWTPRATLFLWSKRPTLAIKTRGMPSWSRHSPVSMVTVCNPRAMKRPRCWRMLPITLGRITRRTSSMSSTN